MSVEEVDTLIVGAGQAGLAMSRHLGAQSVPHIVIEKDRIAERWRSARWDSLVANGPAWHDRFPDMDFDKHAADSFVAKEEVAAYFERYARQTNAPVRCGVEVLSASRLTGRRGFRVETSRLVQRNNVLVLKDHRALDHFSVILCKAGFLHLCCRRVGLRQRRDAQCRASHHAGRGLDPPAIHADFTLAAGFFDPALQQLRELASEPAIQPLALILWPDG